MMVAENTTEMFRNMLIATGVLIGTVVVLVIVGFVVYYKTAEDRHETDNAH